jgi:hypothetical protein
MKVVFIVYRSTDNIFYTYSIYEKDIINFEKGSCVCIINKFNKNREAILSASNLNKMQKKLK